MVSGISKRLHRLETKSGASFDLFDVAVVSAPLPERATAEWSRSMLESVGWTGERVGLWVVDGAMQTLLPITPCDDRLEGEAEAIWLRAGRQYPQYLITAGGGEQVTFRFETADDWKDGERFIQ